MKHAKRKKIPMLDGIKIVSQKSTHGYTYIITEDLRYHVRKA